MKDDVISAVLSSNKSIFEGQYRKEFDLIYGVLWRNGEIDIAIEEEIRYIECRRVAGLICHGEYDFSLSPRDLIMYYSSISFIMAREHYFTGRIFKLASLLGEAFDVFLKGDFLTEKERTRSKRVISETVLDFAYATGNTNCTSIRMKSLIEVHNENKK